MIGGMDANILSDCWILDPASRRWSEVNNADSLIPCIAIHSSGILIQSYYLCYGLSCNHEGL